MMTKGFDSLPPALREGRHLCCWRAIPDKENPEKIGKVPWRVDGLGRLAWSDPANLITFEDAKALYTAGLDLPEHKGQHFAGIGYIIGSSSDLVCIDLDNSITESGEIKPEAKAILERFKSYTEKSPSGRGLHIWIKAEIEGSNIPQTVLDDQKTEIFVRSHHVTLTGDVLPGYEILASRQAETEALYYKLQIIQNSKERPIDPKQKPADKDGRAMRYVEKALEYEAKAVRDETEGNRNNRLNEAAFSISRYARAHLISETEIERTLLKAALACGLDENEARATIKSGIRAGMDNPLYPELEDRPLTLHGDTSSKESVVKEDTEHFTEGGNASRLIRLHGQDMRYCHTFKRWLIWNGQRWELDGSGKAMRYAEDVVRELYRWAAEAPDNDSRDEIASFARACDSNKSLRNVLALASNRESIAITASDLDTDAWSLCAGSFTIDLKDCSVRDPRREDLITKTIGTEYDPGMTCNLWLKFLNRIFAEDQELICYVQRAIGYSLTGSMVEQIYFFCHGKGANGKSVFLAILRALLGDYAKQASFDTFLIQRNAKIRNDLAALAGARIITASEAEEGSKLSMQVIKSWTGGDPITARFLFAEDFTFTPVGKIWLAANHKPVISERNYAAWRRVHLIPFNVTIPKDEQDKELEKKLLEELPGILNWALDGLREYHKTGLEPPEAVKAATEAYRRENDSLEEFIVECCEVRKLAVCKNSDLFGTYQNFCRMSGLETISQRKFSEELNNKAGIKSKRDMHGMVWHGIALKPGWNPGLCRIDEGQKQRQQPNSMKGMKDMKANPQSFENSPLRENFAESPTYPTCATSNEATDSESGETALHARSYISGEDEGPKMGKIDRLTPILTPSQKSALWAGAGRLIRKNLCRTDKGRKGFTAEDLQNETGLLAEDIKVTLEAAGWLKSDEPCGAIFWAPEKTLKAFGEAA